MNYWARVDYFRERYRNAITWYETQGKSIVSCQGLRVDSGAVPRREFKKPLSWITLKDVRSAPFGIILPDIHLSSLFDASRTAPIVISGTGNRFHHRWRPAFRRRLRPTPAPGAPGVRTVTIVWGSRDQFQRMYFNQKYIWNCSANSCKAGRCIKQDLLRGRSWISAGD